MWISMCNKKKNKIKRRSAKMSCVKLLVFMFSVWVVRQLLRSK